MRDTLKQDWVQHTLYMLVLIGVGIALSADVVVVLRVLSGFAAAGILYYIFKRRRDAG